MELRETGCAASRLRLRRAICAYSSYSQHGFKGAARAAHALPVLLEGWRQQARELVLRASSISTFPRRVKLSLKVAQTIKCHLHLFPPGKSAFPQTCFALLRLYIIDGCQKLLQEERLQL